MKMQKITSLQELTIVSEQVRKDLFLQNNNDLPKNYITSINFDEITSCKFLGLTRTDSPRLLKRTSNLINFPNYLENPKFHDKTGLILKEFASKFSNIKRLQPGNYFISLNRYQMEYPNYFSLDRYYNPFCPDQKISTNQLDFLTCFVEKYKEYSFPRIDNNGDFNFKLSMNSPNHFLYFYVPHSTHELIKGLETNFI